MMPLQDGAAAADLASLLTGIVAADVPALPVAGVTLDSRRVEAGWLFLACQGGSRHGMSHARQAVERGACAILAEQTAEWTPAALDERAKEFDLPVIPVPQLGRWASELAGRFHHHPAGGMRVIGVTGTNGKTSVTHFLAQALAPSCQAAVIGTLGNGPLDALGDATHTTPDAVGVQAELARLRDEWAIDLVAMEVSSHGLHQHRVAAIPFHTAVFTNLSRDHLDYHGTFEAYGEAKARLFRTPGLALAVINTDDAFGRQLVHDLEVPVIAVGRDARCRKLGGGFVQLTDIRTDNNGLVFEFESAWGGGRIAAPLFGAFNADNLLPVLALLLEQGLTARQCTERLAGLRSVAGRMEPVAAPGRPGPLVMIDYAHTPDALEKALTSVRAHCTGRLICVFGCGGERDPGKRPLMAQAAERLADQLIVTDDNPRGEDGDAIVADILAGMRSPQSSRVERHRPTAIRAAISQAGPADLVLIAGKGHEDYQLVGDLRLAHSDYAEALAALTEVGS